jgi:hypothetical protein
VHMLKETNYRNTQSISKVCCVLEGCDSPFLEGHNHHHE